MTHPPIADHGYPRPQLVRDTWHSLNGAWDFASERTACWRGLADVQWGRQITVPFAPETPASGVHDTDFHAVCWYRRTFDAPPLAPDARLILHFGAVDYATTVWVNETIVTRHEGGYTPFSADITECLIPDGAQTVIVRAEDDPLDLAKPRGKQDWQREPHAIWYPRTSGIWQTVWLEPIAVSSIKHLTWLPNLHRWEIGLEAVILGPPRDDLRLQVTLRVGEKVLADDTYSVIGNDVTRRIALSDPGIDDYRNELLWSPQHPTLIDADVRLWDGAGNLIDYVRSYTALRSVMVQGDRFLLNGRPLRLRMVLDQGYWPASGLTAPDDAALRRDVELAKAMGFNGVRKHQKIEDPRYLAWADRLGLLVWEEMPSAYRFTKNSIERLVSDWFRAMDRDLSHPCIVAWVPFNESWGVPDLPNIEAQRDYVRTLYHLTKTLDPDRPVIGNDGWESVATDIIAIHDYDDDLERIERRYSSPEAIPNLFKEALPAGRLVSLAADQRDQPIMLTEFGGITLSQDPGAWGYAQVESEHAFAERYLSLLAAVRSFSLFAGFCYTQFADTYQETNGLLYADRTPKFPLEQICAATRGPLQWAAGSYGEEPPC
ncbi:MAG: glycoside hydrolase family 2 [Thermomicrobia bacterium]|nr:glycoside hydrolase family 2 [Thermomicrobia bacterium]MCA1722927.1 glycoside hydrolase family 2 [Thermomicrobia bacterium]